MGGRAQTKDAGPRPCWARRGPRTPVCVLPAPRASKSRTAGIMPAVPSYGPIRTGRGTCHERALRFGRREAPIRCGFARTYVPNGDRRVGHTETPPGTAHHRPTTGGWLGARGNPVGGGQRGAVEDVGLADLDLVEAEAAHRFEQDHGARDDGGRPVWVEPGHAPAGVDGQGGELGHDSLAGASPDAVAVDFLGVV